MSQQGTPDKKTALNDIHRVLLLLGLPVISFGTTLMEITKIKNEWLPICVYAYGIFLAFYLLLIMVFEYTTFSELHTLKSVVIDLVLLLGLFLSIRQLSFASDSLVRFLALCCLGLLCIVGWEIYTMYVGFEKYFKPKQVGLTPLAMIRDFGRVFLLRWDIDHVEHWDEYRWWVMLDSVLLVVFSGLFLERTLSPHTTVAWDERIYKVSLLFGFLTGVFNTYRYFIVKKAVVARRLP